MNIFGVSGEGKTWLAYELLDKSNRQAVIIREPSQWEDVDVTKDLIVLLDDMFGRFGLDITLKNSWMRKLGSMYAAVRGGKIQIITTSRQYIFSECKKELEQYDMFQARNGVRLNDYVFEPEMKLNMIKKYISTRNPTITVCRDKEEEMLHSTKDEIRRISEPTLARIARIETNVGFPQCCHMFVSTPACFSKGAHFFENPTEVIIKDIEKMFDSEDELEKLNFLTLAYALVCNRLTDEQIDNINEDNRIRAISDACRIPTTTPLSGEVRHAAQRLKDSYLNYSNGAYTLRHNSLIEAVFISLFEAMPQLLIEHCSFQLLVSCVSPNEREANGEPTLGTYILDFNETF